MKLARAFLWYCALIVRHVPSSTGFNGITFISNYHTITCYCRADRSALDYSSSTGKAVRVSDVKYPPLADLYISRSGCLPNLQHTLLFSVLPPPMTSAREAWRDSFGTIYCSVLLTLPTVAYDYYIIHTLQFQLLPFVDNAPCQTCSQTMRIRMLP